MSEATEVTEATELEVVTKLPEQTFAMRQPVAERLVTLGNLWDVHVRIRGDLSKSTRMDYAKIGRYFCGFMKGKEFSPDMMTQWHLFLKDEHRGPDGEKISAYYVNKINSRVRGFLRWLKTMGHLSEDFSRCIPSLRCNEIKEAQYITEDEFGRIKEYCRTKIHFQAHLWLCILSYRTGMSLIDCCYLRWQNIHVDPNGPCYLKIHRIKTARFGAGSACYIPLIPGTDVWQWLCFLRKAPRYKRHDGIDDYVHQDTTGLYECTWQKIGQDFKAIFRFAKVEEGKTFKHFRNSFCSNLVNSEVQLALICKMTGHKNLRTLLRYLQPDFKALADGLNKAFHFSATQAGKYDSEAAVALFDTPSTIDITPNEQRDTAGPAITEGNPAPILWGSDGPHDRSGSGIQGSLPAPADGGPSECHREGVVGEAQSAPGISEGQ